MFEHPLFRLFFDVTANHGWNLTAYVTYGMIIGLIILAIYEAKTKP